MDTGPFLSSRIYAWAALQAARLARTPGEAAAAALAPDVPPRGPRGFRRAAPVPGTGLVRRTTPTRRRVAGLLARVRAAQHGGGAGAPVVAGRT